MDFPNLSAAKEIYIDLETKDPNLKKLGPGWARHDVTVVGIALAIDDCPAKYYPIAHTGFENFDRDLVLRWILGTDCLRSGKSVGGHNLPYDIGGLGAEDPSGFETLLRSLRTEDSMIGGALLDEDLEHYSLDYLAKLWLGEQKEETGIRQYADEHKLDPKADLWRMPPEVVGPYACADVELTRKLLKYERAEIAKQEGLSEAWQLECDLIPMSIAMRRAGIRMNVKGLEEATAELRILKEKAIKEANGRWNVDLSPWAASSCAALLMSAGIEPPYHTDSNGKRIYSITKPWLTLHASFSGPSADACRIILAARGAAKAAGTFIDGWQRHLYNGRLHPEWHQSRSDEGGTISWRYSCSNPNLQQVPARDPVLTNLLRRLFLPEEGERFYSLDYSQQEPRLLVHYAHTNKVLGAADAHRMYADDESADFHNIATKLMTGRDDDGSKEYKALRTIYKQINLGIIYGMGRKKLAASTGKPVEEAISILAEYRSRMPFMSEMAKIAANVASSRGYIKTLGGYRRRFNLWEPDAYSEQQHTPLRREDAECEWPNRPLRRAYSFTGLNALVQTSAAAQMKMAMRECWKAGILPKLQIHDELLISGDEKQAKQVAEIMRGIKADTLTVPFKVDIAEGSTWAEAT